MEEVCLINNGEHSASQELCQVAVSQFPQRRELQNAPAEMRKTISLKDESGNAEGLERKEAGGGQGKGEVHGRSLYQGRMHSVPSSKPHSVPSAL